MQNLSEAKIGSKIAISRRYLPGVNILYVTAVTKKQIVCGYTRIRKSDGLVLGLGEYARFATEKDSLQNRIESTATRLNKVKITEDNLVAAEIFLEASKPKG